MDLRYKEGREGGKEGREEGRGFDLYVWREQQML